MRRLACVVLLVPIVIAAQSGGSAGKTPTIRIVEGRAYNISQSTNWLEIGGKCVKVRTNGVVIATQYKDDSPKAGDPVGKEMFIRNYPTNNIAEGQRLEAKAMKVGTITLPRIDGTQSTIEMWDHGTLPVSTGNKPATSESKPRK